MARYGPEHKQATRRRMLDTASRRFKSDGFDGAGIAALVSDAGLTNGAFYGHFDSKDALIAEVLAEQFARQAEQIAALPPGGAAVREFISDYLSVEHRDDVAGGCPSAALLDEVGRRDQAARTAYTAGAAGVVQALADHLMADGASVEDATSRAIATLSLMVGALQSARAVNDPRLSEQVLATARAHAIAIVDAPAPPPTQRAGER